MDAAQGKLNPGAARKSESACIEEQIDRTRACMDGTISRIQDRLSFRRLGEDLGDLLIDGAGSGSRRLIQGIRNNPVPAGLVGLGIAWMIAERSKSRRCPQPQRGYYGGYEPTEAHRSGPGFGQKIGERISKVGERISEGVQAGVHGVQEGVHRAREVMHDAGDQVASAASVTRSRIAGFGYTIRETAVEAGEGVAHGVSHAAQQARHAAERAGRTVVHTYDENPLVVGAAAFAAGLLGGLAVPTTKTEDRLMGRASKDLKDRARNLGEQAYHAGEEIATSVARGAREGAFAGGDVADRIILAAETAVNAGAQVVGKQAKVIMGRDDGQQPRQGGQQGGWQQAERGTQQSDGMGDNGPT